MKKNSHGDLEHNSTEDKLKRTTTANTRPTQKGNNLKSKTNLKGQQLKEQDKLKQKTTLNGRYTQTYKNLKCKKTLMKDNLKCKTNLNVRQSQREEDAQLD